MKPAAPSKDEKILSVGLLLLSELTSYDEVKLNISTIAKKAGVSRAWVYKYFGNSQDEIVLSAIDSVAPQLTELGKQLDKVQGKTEWARQYLKGLNQTLLEVEQYPALFRFYFICHLHGGPYLERIRLHEGLFVEHRVIPQLKAAFELSYPEARQFAEMLMAMRMGLVLKWLNEPNPTAQNRQKLISTVRTRVFG